MWTPCVATDRQLEKHTHLRIPLVWCLVSWLPRFQCKTMWSLTDLWGIRQKLALQSPASHNGYSRPSVILIFISNSKQVFPCWASSLHRQPAISTNRLYLMTSSQMPPDTSAVLRLAAPASSQAPESQQPTAHTTRTMTPTLTLADMLTMCHMLAYVSSQSYNAFCQ